MSLIRFSRPSKLASLTPEEFHKLYFEQKKSLAEIGSLYGVSRITVHKWYKDRKGKATPKLRPTGRPASHGESEEVFSSWTPEMAYALGVLATDGCVSKWRVTLSCTDLDMVEKVKAIVKSDFVLREVAPVGYSRKVQYLLTLNSIALVRMLTDFGVTAQKSLTLRFPEMPQECVRHFIRGCWDGDGSFYTETRRPNYLMASYVGGSRIFIESMVRHLDAAGIAPASRPIWRQDERGTWGPQTVTGIRIHTLKPREKSHQTNSSYYIKLSGKHAIDLGIWMYAGVPPALYMERKHSVWRKAANAAEKERESVDSPSAAVSKTSPISS